MTRDPIDLAREELRRLPAPTSGEVDAQRARFDASLAAPAPMPRARPARRRWLPASGLAVAGVAVAAFLVVALQPGRSSHDDSGGPKPHGLQLVTGSGAFAKLDLDTASAADVLGAAGDSAAAGTPDLTGPTWTFSRIESNDPKAVDITELWTSPDGERQFSIHELRIAGRGPLVSIHYEHLRDLAIGDVGWVDNSGGPGPRRATWSTNAGDGQEDLDRVVRLHDALRDVSSVEGVRRALEESMQDDDITYRDGMACGSRGSSCMSIGASPRFSRGISATDSRQMLQQGMLLQSLSGNVYGEATTKAVYGYLATLPGVSVAAAPDGSDDVLLRYHVRSDHPSTIDLATLDGDTGRIVSWGGMNARWTETGVSSLPMVGGELCPKHPEACGELRDLATRLDTDPKARFKGVVDWMFIAQFCDGLINRDGSTKQDAGMPLSMSKDPAAKAKRDACEKREAAAAQGG